MAEMAQNARDMLAHLRDIFYGMTTYEMVRDLKKERARLGICSY
jgi:hypothetical protein